MVNIFTPEILWFNWVGKKSCAEIGIFFSRWIGK